MTTSDLSAMTPVDEQARPLAADLCPNYHRCQHSPSTRIGRSGRCPDCGHHVFAGAVIHDHHGSWMSGILGYEGPNGL